MIDFHTGGSKTYRGGSAQWMRTGAGAQHEEFWEMVHEDEEAEARAEALEAAEEGDVSMLSRCAC